LKAIILAAGQGTRLMPLTKDKPKCMVEIKEKPIIDYILETMTSAGIKDIIIVNGYQNNVLEKYLNNKEIKFITNFDYKITNMVYTLFMAVNEMNDNLIISYSDIIYSKEVLTTLINDDSKCSVVVDKEWYKLWSLRMENPLSDAETMKLNNKNNIIELGKKTQSYSDIQGQYIGLIKFSKEILPKIKEIYQNADRTILYDNQTFKNMYMTSFLQLIINLGIDVKAVLINGGWFEVDTLTDVSIFNKLNK